MPNWPVVKLIRRRDMPRRVSVVTIAQIAEWLETETYLPESALLSDGVEGAERALSEQLRRNEVDTLGLLEAAVAAAKGET
jgi:hypothetical protein